jgi:hypothetical protein
VTARAFDPPKKDNFRLTDQLVGSTWGEALSINTALVHLDLSNNNYNKAICKIIAEDIKQNHTIYGLHMNGNSCQVDSNGFIVFPEE